MPGDGAFYETSMIIGQFPRAEARRPAVAVRPRGPASRCV